MPSVAPSSGKASGVSANSTHKNTGLAREFCALSRQGKTKIGDEPPFARGKMVLFFGHTKPSWYSFRDGKDPSVATGKVDGFHDIIILNFTP